MEDSDRQPGDSAKQFVTLIRSKQSEVAGVHRREAAQIIYRKSNRVSGVIHGVANIPWSKAAQEDNIQERSMSPKEPIRCSYLKPDTGPPLIMSDG